MPVDLWVHEGDDLSLAYDIEMPGKVCGVIYRQDIRQVIIVFEEEELEPFMLEHKVPPELAQKIMARDMINMVSVNEEGEIGSQAKVPLEIDAGE